jgi:predicted nucleic acid-binding protein
MNILVDTNVVVGFVARGQPRHAPATSAVNRLLADDHELFLVPQVCYEFWVVATRPQDDNGLGLSHADARRVSTGCKKPSACSATNAPSLNAGRQSLTSTK